MRQIFCVCADVLARLGLGGLFVYSAWSKMQDPALFAESVADYQLLPTCLVGLFALILPMVELLVGIMVVATKWPREAGVVMVGLLGVFIVALAQAWWRGLEISCGCFGRAEPDGPNELLWTIARDFILLIPAVWISIRPNGWIGVKQVSPALVLMCSLVTACSPENKIESPKVNPSPVVETNRVPDEVAGEDKEPPVTEAELKMDLAKPVSPAVWTFNFPRALELAQSNNVPLIVVAGMHECTYCNRLRTVTHGSRFAQWARSTGVYLVEAYYDTTNRSIAQARAVEFLEQDEESKKMAWPHVGVYWKNGPTGEVRSMFIGRRDAMPGGSAVKLEDEFGKSLDLLIGTYTRSKGVGRLQSAAARTMKHIQVACEGKGKVYMVPKSGELPHEKNASVKIVAEGEPGAKFLGWKDPRGQIIKRSRDRLTYRLRYDKAESGLYTAVFE